MLGDVASAMAKHAPPAWAKLALNGALLTERVALYAAKGTFRAYLPPYHLQSDDSPLPNLIRAGRDPIALIERYGLSDIDRPNLKDIDIWTDIWDGEAKRLALGWLLLHEPFDWSEPRLKHTFFEVPRDWEAMFAHDDIHPEGEPDDALYYEADFQKLCLEQGDAETLVPMANFESISFASVNDGTWQVMGRPPGTGYQSADAPLVKKMVSDLEANPNLSHREVAERYVDEAAGHATRDSKRKRLERRLRGAI